MAEAAADDVYYLAVPCGSLAIREDLPVRHRGSCWGRVNMEASRWWACTWPKPATSKLSFMLVRSVKGTGSAAARAAAAGEAGEPSDGGRSCIGASAVGAGGAAASIAAGRCGPTIVD